MLNRRKFLINAAVIAGGALAGAAKPVEDDTVERLTILHTNDVHSRLEPFPMDAGKNAGLGGVAARAGLIHSVREKEKNVLLLDAGDIFQGTPYFNLYKGEPEIKAMTKMGYDAATMGNHDFDGGMENFSTQLRNAGFPIVLCNYDFTGTPLEQKTVPYKIFKKGRLKIGVTGVGIKMEGLVPENLFGKTKYLDPVQHANATAEFLKRKQGCDMVICLSHLGFGYKEPDKMCDEILSKESEHIDLILGGHTHTFMDHPAVFKNRNGNDVIVNQVGWAGIMLGRLDFVFEKKKKKNLADAHTVVIGEKSSE
ncbi:MAG: metallophosphatase [Chitinophagaceae bacterium]|nr:metallophosphatase [Chitinophagaceae bacterium]